MTTSPKQPQDRKPKAKAPEEVPDAYEFEHDGNTYTLKPTAEVVNFGFLRRHRDSDQQKVIYTLLELLAEPEVLAVLDEMPLPATKDLLAGFDEYITSWVGATMGESAAS